MLSSMTRAPRSVLGGRNALVTAALAVAIVGAAFAGPVPAPSHDGPVALVNVDIYPVDGPVVERGTVVWERGVITAVGRDLGVPASAQRIDAAGARVYPAFIACGTQLGLIEIEAVRATRDTSEVGELNPNVRAEIAVNPDSELIPVTRAGGVGLVQTMPSGGLVSGSSALLRLDGWTWEEMVVKAPVGVHVQWPTMRIAEPEDKTEERRAQRDRDLARIHELFARARAYERAKPGASEIDLRCEALIPVVRGEVPVFLHANAWRDIDAAVRWAVESGLRCVLVGGRDAPRVASLLRAHDVPVIYGPVHDLPRHRSDPFDEAFVGPLRLHEAGVKFAIASFDTSNARNLPYEAATAAAHGLPPEVALRAITQAPAEIFGLADRLGSIAVGKVASLQLTDGDPLEITTKVLRLWLDGTPVDLANRHTSLYEKYGERIRRDATTRRGRF